MLNSFIWAIDRTLSGATSPGRSEPGSDGDEGVLRIYQNSSINEASPWDGLVSYLGNFWGGSYSTAEMQSVYSIVPADWVLQISSSGGLWRLAVTPMKDHQLTLVWKTHME